MLAGALAVPATAWAQTSGAWPSALMMATGRPGGAYDVYGPAWGRLAEEMLAISIAYRASGGAASDILLIEQGAVQLGMTTVTVADQARTGTGQWTCGVKFENFRALFPMFPSILQIVSPQKTKISAIRDLAGRTIGIGPDGGSGAAFGPGIGWADAVVVGGAPPGSTTTRVPTLTRSNRSETSSFSMPMQPEDTNLPIVDGWLVPWIR